MRRTYHWLLAGAVMAGLLGSISLARFDDNKIRHASAKNKRTTNDPRSNSATVKAGKGDLKIEVGLKGVVEAEWDYPLYNYHQQYGTAFALMSLQRCRKEDTGRP